MKIHDISVTVHPGMASWPGHPPIRLELYRSLACGDSSDSSQLSCSVHTGTHLDSPAHFIAGGAGVVATDLNSLIGPAWVVAFEDVSEIDVACLERASIPQGTQRVLFKTSNSRWWRETEPRFHEDYVSLTTEGAEWLTRRGIKLVGIDYLSIQKFRDRSSRTHHVLLEAGVAILEGIDLGAVTPGAYQLYCLPLKLAGADGAPARAVLIEESS